MSTLHLADPPTAHAPRARRGARLAAVARGLARLASWGMSGRGLVHALLVACLELSALAHAQSAARVVRVGVYDNPPKIFLAADGSPAGFFGELLQEIADRENWRLQAVPCTWSQCLAQLQDGRIDLMPDVARTPEREASMRFGPEAALRSWSQVFRHPSQRIESILDLHGKRLAHLKDSVQPSQLDPVLESFGVRVQWLGAATFDEAFAMVRQGQADAAVSNQLYGAWRAPEHQLLATPVVFAPSALYIVSSLTAPAEPLATVDRYLSQWKAQPDSPYHRILHHWDGGQTAAQLRRLLIWLAAGAALAVLSLLALNTWLRRKVARATHAIRASEAKLAAVLDSVEAAIYLKDPEGRYTYANRKASDILGQPPERIIGRTDDDFFGAEAAARIRHSDHTVLTTRHKLTAEETHRRPTDGQERTYITVKIPLLDARQRPLGVCGIATDITEQRQTAQALRRLAHFDPLTQLPNRRALTEQLARAIESVQRQDQDGALIHLDLDHFKDANDLLGRPGADALLCAVADRLSAARREGDFLARVGGDEFVLLATGLDRIHAAEQAMRLAQNLRASLQRPFSLGPQGEELTLSASIGLVLLSSAPHDPDALLHWVDTALHTAKEAGRNQIRFFDPAMQTRAQAHAALLQDIRRALGQREFLLFYQPQIDAQGRLCGIEALARWAHPQRGLTAPGTFVPAIEQSELIVEWGAQILHQACQQLAHWQRLPTTTPWRLAVNISAAQFHDPGFATLVLQTLRDCGADPQRLELELTESLLLNRADAVIHTMTQLRQHGIAFSLDDFGTGYSSLAYLKRLPLSQIKIDQSFVRDLDHSPESQAIVRAIIALSQSLELDILAEGVETPAQRDILIHLGCQRFQGYLFSPPVPPAELSRRWLCRPSEPQPPPA